MHGDVNRGGSRGNSGHPMSYSGCQGLAAEAMEWEGGAIGFRQEVRAGLYSFLLESPPEAL